MGLKSSIFGFADKIGANTYWDFYDEVVDMNAMGTNLLNLMDNADSIHFNLDGLQGSWDDIARWGSEGIGQGNVTNWEFHQIINNSNYFEKTTFYLNGKPYSGINPIP